MDLDREDLVMKIIDEKGRLFGKINVIDFLVILFFICLTPMFYFGYKIIYKNQQEALKQKAQKKTFLEIDFDCLLIKLDPKVASLVSVGNKEINNKGEVIAEILKVGNASPYVYQFNTDSRKKIIKSDPVLKQIPVILKIKTEARQDKLYYKDKQILDNSILNLTTDKYQVEGKIMLQDQSIPIPDNIKQKIDELEKNTNTLKESIEDIYILLRNKEDRKYRK